MNFDILETDIQPSVGGDETLVRIEMHLGEVEDLDGDTEQYRSEDWEWGAFGFVFCLAVLSFHDARPRGISGVDFEEGDEFAVADMVDCLQYQRGELRFSADELPEFIPGALHQDRHHRQARREDDRGDPELRGSGDPVGAEVEGEEGAGGRRRGGLRSGGRTASSRRPPAVLQSVLQMGADPGVFPPSRATQRPVKPHFQG